MTQEEKNLLLKDICTRLPYGVMVLGPWKKDGPCKLSEVNTLSNRQVRVFEDYFNIEEVRPYLRPMSSMTEKERNYLTNEFLWETIGEDNSWYTILRDVRAHEYIDWLNEHHFDYRGLIEKGLALEATEDMYVIK